MKWIQTSLTFWTLKVVCKVQIVYIIDVRCPGLHYIYQRGKKFMKELSKFYLSLVLASLAVLVVIVIKIMTIIMWLLQEPQRTPAVSVRWVVHGAEPGVASALQHEPGGWVLRESGGRRPPALRPVAPHRVPAGPAAPAVTQPQHRTPPHCHRLAASHGRHSQGIGCRASQLGPSRSDGAAPIKTFPVIFSFSFFLRVILLPRVLCPCVRWYGRHPKIFPPIYFLSVRVSCLT